MGVDDQEFLALIRADGESRRRYWIRCVADLEEVWSLRDTDGWVLSATSGQVECVPVWSHVEYAEACAVGRWDGCLATRIELVDWMDRWLPGMARDKKLAEVFMVPSGRGCLISPSDLREQLVEELRSY